MGSGQGFRIGCDIGGTFTDVVLFDEGTGEITLVKIPTTPRKPEIGAASCIKRAIDRVDVDPQDITFVCHATTVATNAIIGQVGLELSKTGFITTKGFRDLVEIGRQIRPNPYDFFTQKPRVLVPRYLRKEVTERIGYDGKVIQELDEEEARRAVQELKDEKVDSIAVCTLFSFLNPVHEKRIGEIIKEEYPEVSISLSHEILPEFREYERASTTIINAFLYKIVDRYIRSLEEKLRGIGVAAELLLMQSMGRMMTAEMARRMPVTITESGPAAGAIAAAFIGRLIGYRDLVSFDMGGTTTKVCLIEKGEPKVSTEYEVGSFAHGGRMVRGSGWPIKVPVTDLVEIGAGGGSMAWIDPGGALRVGPQSAGADPGPVCYNLGGTKPTITDAYVVLGIINPDYFIGGEMKIYPDLAEKSIQEQIAEPLHMDLVDAAYGIARVANSNMIRAVRIVTVERGYDPRDLAIMAFGGAGPMVIGEIADELDFQTVIVPEAPGLFSAYGLLVTNLGHDYVLTRIIKTDEIDPKDLNQAYQRMEERGIGDLTKEGIPRERMVISRSADMRYVGQSYELNVPVPLGEITADIIGEIEKGFHQAHGRRYGYFVEGEPVEFVNLRVSAVGLVPPLKLRKDKEKGRAENPPEALKGYRRVYFAKYKDYIRCPIFDKYKLRPGDIVKGPAIIEQVDTTTVLQPDHKAKIDGYRQILITKE